MINQQNQQQQSPQLGPTQVQIRQNLALKQFDQNSQQLLAANQPLSPTHITTSQKPQDQKLRDGGRQLELKGVPSLVGLTSIEYQIDESFDVNLNLLKETDFTDNYLSQFFEENDEAKPLKNQSVHKTYQRVEVTINLSCQMTLEHIEMHISNFELFSKYLTLLKVEKKLESELTDTQLHLKSAFLDKNKKILELNVCGVASQIKIVFLYNLKSKPSEKSIREMQDKRKEQIFSKTQNVSEKIKNEIIPLLNGNDEDIDELDDEVAMISKKRGNEKMKTQKDVLRTDDIKIEVGQQSAKPQPNVQDESKQPQRSKKDETRNFDTFPRNYSDSSSKQNIEASMNDLANDNQNDNKDLQQISQNLQIAGSEEQSHIAEQEIFGDNYDESCQIHRLLQKSFSQINVTGFNCNQISAITNMTFFINQSFLMKQKQKIEEALEYEYLSGVLMISTKRLNQAVETFRKIQSHYLRQLEQLQKNKKSNQNLQSQTLFLKCATLELLIQDSMSQPAQMNDKLNSLTRMVDLFQYTSVKPMVFAPQTTYSDDPFTVTLRILPSLLRFTIMCLTHKREAVKLAALRLLEYILETQGCSLDQSMVFILKAIFKTYPQMQLQGNSEETNEHQQSFNVNGFTQSVQEYFKYDEEGKYNQEQRRCSRFKNKKEPNSGYLAALKNAYNHTLDTYISVLSSISSHILHQLFYEVIIPCFIESKDDLNTMEIKLFAVKISEKIITICQGDLILNRASLEFFVTQTISKSQNLQNSNSNNSDMYATSIKSLWSSIRTKVFTNYSQKGLKTLIEWLVDKMSQIASNAQSQVNTSNQQQQMNTESSGNQDISKLEISDEDSQQLFQLFDIVSMISVGRKNNEAEANSLIKIKQDYCIELYLLINPLLFWLDFSVEREERFPLFKQVYATIKDVLDNLPSKRVDIDLLQIMIPILQRTTDFLKNNSPSQHMLKFLDLVLRDIKAGGYCQVNSDLQYFFLDMLNNLVDYISYCLHEEVFSVFDKLMFLCADVVNEKVLTKCIVAMVDKYTLKSKAQKNSMTQFMKSLMEVKVRARNKDSSSNRTLTNQDEEFDEDQISVHSKNNYFEILCDFCFFNNSDPMLAGSKAYSKPRDDFKSLQDLHDLYIDKLNFFVESLQLLSEIHVNLFTSMITHPSFKPTLIGLLSKGETSLRLKCHEILEVIANYYVQHCTSKTVYKIASQDNKKGGQQNSSGNEMMEVEYINHERLYISQIVLQCVKQSLEQKSDSYLQFNSLILLDFLFQNLLPVPTYQNEIQKERINKNNNESRMRGDQVIDLETLDINEETPEFEVTANQYTYLRLELIFKLWPYVQQALNSAWSNIRSICYGLICSMLKVDIKSLSNDTNQIAQQIATKLKEIVLPMLYSLLSSKESESKAGGLNILGSFCGLSYDFSKVKISKNMEFFKKNSPFISIQIWQLVFDLQDDWDITIKEASVVLIQLCAPRDAVKYFDRQKQENEDKRFTEMLQRYGLGHNGVTSGGDLSSRISSARGQGDHQYLIQHSLASHREEETKQKKDDIFSFLNSGQQDDTSLAMHMEAAQEHNRLGGSQLFDDVGNTIISGQTAQLGGLLKGIAKDQKLDLQSEQFELTEKQKEFVKGGSVKFEFFVDTYSDEQIQEIISIFRNDFKPPKNLWIEKNQQSGFNGPDYYSEIFASAIDQFNQQQLQLQQQQQQQQQQMVNNSPKNSVGKAINIPGGSIVDALEDDLVSKYENQNKQKSQDDAGEMQQKEGNYMIFERHFEDGKEQQQQSTEQTQQMRISENAEQYTQKQVSKSPDNEKEEGKQKQKKKQKEEKKKSVPINQLQLDIIDEAGVRPQKPQENKQAPAYIDEKPKQQKKSIKDKRTTDELIEEYERKISKTKQLLEEEKIKNKTQTYKFDIAEKHQLEGGGAVAKSTPDFKQQKKDTASSMIQTKVFQDENNYQSSKSGEKHLRRQQDLVPKNYLSNNDNAKLIKQINHCFNDNSFNNFNIGPVVMTNGGAGAKHKQKLNKSYENLQAANKQKYSSEKYHNKKNLSSSPKRGSSSGKKSGAKSAGYNKKKYLDQSYQYSSKNQPKHLQNMRDLNYFIKTIEKDLSEKFNKLNMKDFNSMPTTPTSILKKVEDQMKAMANNNVYQGDVRTQMSNTCPNITQMLGQLDPVSQYQKQKNQNVLQVSQQKMNGAQTKKQQQAAPHSGYSDICHSSQITPSNVTKSNQSNMVMAPSSNSLSNYNFNQGEKFTFSKTQKLDLKDANKNIFGNQVNTGRDGQTARDNSTENYKRVKTQPTEGDKHGKAQKGQKYSAQNKRSRGSQDKYLTGKHGTNSILLNNSSGSSSQNKLNKSLNNISSNGSNANNKKKDQLSKSMINSFAKASNMSPNNKKLIQNMIKQQLGSNQNNVQYHTPVNTQPNYNNQQQSHSSNFIQDYIHTSEQTGKKFGNNVKTPVKAQAQKLAQKNGNYSEIIQISPSSGEKEIRYFTKNFL